jgi:hypothetical protein
MPSNAPEEIVFKLLALTVSARGRVAFGITAAVALVLTAIAWRIAVH